VCCKWKTKHEPSCEQLHRLANGKPNTSQVAINYIGFLVEKYTKKMKKIEKIKNSFNVLENVGKKYRKVKLNF